MARTETNKFSLQVAVETTPGVLPGSPTWFLLEPNEPGDFGATITTVPRDPISKARQLGKGVVTALESSVSYTHDLVLDNLPMFLEGFCFAEAANYDLAFRGINIDATGYIIPAATAAQAAKLQWVTGGPKSLIYSVGYANSANNGLKVLTADTGLAGTAIAFSGAVVETAPTNAVAELAGVRGIAGDLAITVSGSTATLTSGNNAISGGNQINFTTLGLTVGQFIHVGGIIAGQQFSAGVGYGRITSIAAATVLLDKLVGTLATDPGTGESVDLLFSRFVRNVDVDANAEGNRFLSRTFQFEGAYQDLGGAGIDEYEYALGNYSNEFTLNIPIAEKSTYEMAFIGLDTDVPTTSRATNGATPILPLRNAGFSTTTDVVNLRTSAVAAADTCFQDLTITINNNATPESCIGTLGAEYVNLGNFTVELEAEMLFASDDIPDAIRNNTTVTMDAILKNGDGGFALDFPSMTLEGGERDFPKNESIRINLTGRAFRDTTLGTSIGISFFPVLP